MRRRYWIGLTLVVVAAVVVVRLWPTGPRPCRATFDKVAEGMTRDDVIATVGTPPGDYTTRPISFGPATSLATTWKAEYWGCDEAALHVRFGDDGRAEWVRVRKPWLSDPPPSLVDRIRQRLGL